MRKKIIAGNWKMNKTPSQTVTLITSLASFVEDSAADLVVCPPHTALLFASEVLRGTNIALGAQNMHYAENGAYTGEIAANMLLECGVRYVIIGHSERRQYFAETDETVNQKIKTALSASIIPIVCVGESLDQRTAGTTEEIVTTQIERAFQDIPIESASSIVIAYEPIWAIGTGQTATSAQADEVCAIIRKKIANLYDDETAENIRIQYGGSMNEKNAADLLSQPNIDGGLIGGASLSAEKFAEIAQACPAHV